MPQDADFGRLTEIEDIPYTIDVAPPGLVSLFLKREAGGHVEHAVAVPFDPVALLGRQAEPWLADIAVQDDRPRQRTMPLVFPVGQDRVDSGICLVEFRVPGQDGHGSVSHQQVSHQVAAQQTGGAGEQCVFHVVFRGIGGFKNFPIDQGSIFIPICLLYSFFHILPTAGNRRRP